jgi:hypothetical protein
MMLTMHEGLSPELSHLVETELAKGERIVWLGQPIPSRYARMGLGQFAFAIPFIAFSIFWIAAASGFKLPDFSKITVLFPLWGVPFVLVGLWTLSTPLRLHRRALRTAYVITNVRALIVSRGALHGATIQSFGPSSLTSLLRTQLPDGSGHLYFKPPKPASNRRQASDPGVGFLAVSDVKEVEDLVRELSRKSEITKS